jgi:hypothetical protein
MACSGIRLSLWRGGSGVSIPLSRKGRTIGKVGVGPISWYGQSGESRSSKPTEDVTAGSLQTNDPAEVAAIEAFRADRRFLERLQQHGMPWRGVQERLKEELPSHLAAQDSVAFGLVPKAMSAAFGQQGAVWGTEKRPSKSGSGLTTWIVVK